MAAEKRCRHNVLQLEPSPFAELAGFERPDARKRIAAAKKSGRLPPEKKSGAKAQQKEADTLSQTFPAPLVLPHDDLNYEPDEPAQSVRHWLQGGYRNPITKDRSAFYVARVPEVDGKMRFLEEWVDPRVDVGKERPAKRAKVDVVERKEAVASPSTDDVMDYLKAFYHGMEVKEFPDRLRWVPWTGQGRSTARTFTTPQYVALQHGDQATRIRARPAPDDVFAAQMNLNDILDAAIAMLPADAYAILLMVDHDIYESDEDDFCCGRAYGGSRVAVVQSARYNPLLDAREGCDYSHMWPMSHCKAFVDKLCAVEDVKEKPATVRETRLSKGGAMRAAINAAAALPVPSTPADFSALWFSRIARTASHELGHCMGVGHCVYYACNMQGTASMKEDVRQPPYLCPVCLARLSYAVAEELEGGDENENTRYAKERYEAIAAFCGRRGDVGMWKALGAWIENVLGETSPAMLGR